MTARLPVWRSDAQREGFRQTRRDEHAAAFKAATTLITRFLVADVGKPGQRLMEEIADGSKRGPAEVLEQIVVVARRHKDEAAAAAPVRTLARRLGYDLAPAGDEGGAGPVSATCASVVRQVGTAISDVLEAIADGRVTAAESARCLPELELAIQDLHRLRAQIHAGAATR